MLLEVISGGLTKPVRCGAEIGSRMVRTVVGTAVFGEMVVRRHLQGKWRPAVTDARTANPHSFVGGFLAVSSHVPVHAANTLAMRAISRRAAFFVGNRSPSGITMPPGPV